MPKAKTNNILIFLRMRQYAVEQFTSGAAASSSLHYVFIA